MPTAPENDANVSLRWFLFFQKPAAGKKSPFPQQIKLYKNYPRLSFRLNPNNPNHHLWNNNGTIFFDCTIHPTPYTKLRIRHSLQTSDLSTALIKRDFLLGELLQGIFPAELKL